MCVCACLPHESSISFTLTHSLYKPNMFDVYIFQLFCTIQFLPLGISLSWCQPPSHYIYLYVHIYREKVHYTITSHRLCCELSSLSFSSSLSLLFWCRMREQKCTLPLSKISSCIFHPFLCSFESNLIFIKLNLHLSVKKEEKKCLVDVYLLKEFNEQKKKREPGRVWIASEKRLKPLWVSSTPSYWFNNKETEILMIQNLQQWDWNRRCEVPWCLDFFLLFLLCVKMYRWVNKTSIQFTFFFLSFSFFFWFNKGVQYTTSERIRKTRERETNCLKFLSYAEQLKFIKVLYMQERGWLNVLVTRKCLAWLFNKILIMLMICGAAWIPVSFYTSLELHAASNDKEYKFQWKRYFCSSSIM